MIYMFVWEVLVGLCKSGDSLDDVHVLIMYLCVCKVLCFGFVC